MSTSRAAGPHTAAAGVPGRGLEQVPSLLAGMESESGAEEGTEIENKGLA